MFTKMYILSNTEYRSLITDVLDVLGYEEVTEKNIKEVVDYIWENLIECETDIDGFMIVDSKGEWIGIWSQDRLTDFISREEIG